MADAVLLDTLESFGGGHYGAVGARHADNGTWGGVNVCCTREGGVGPVSASRKFRFSNLVAGEIMGVFYAYGVDGRVYFVQRADDAFVIRRFTPNPEDAAITIEDVDDQAVCDRLPDWATSSGLVYVTFWGDKTYSLDPAAPGKTLLTTALIGDVPGGRAICFYGERMYVGGINDARFAGTHGNRTVYSEAADPANVPDLNFFDAGADNIEIAALYPMQNQLAIVLQDQTWWGFNGVPGFSANLRRQNAYQKGTGGIASFTHDHGAVDPVQTRAWAYDHISRSPTRWNGSSLTRVPNFGVISPDRTAVGRVEGAMAMVGGPDEFVMDRVAMPRTDSGEAVDADLVFVRMNGAVALVERKVLTGRA